MRMRSMRWGTMAVVALLLGSPVDGSAQSGRTKPDAPPGEPPVVFVFFDEGFSIRVGESGGVLRVVEASPIPSSSTVPTPLRTGDELIDIATRRPTSLAALDAYLDSMETGDAVAIAVRRDGEVVLETFHLTTIQALLADGRLGMGLGGQSSPGRLGDPPSEEPASEAPAWSSAPAATPFVSLAGNRIEADEAGNLIVTFKTRHPAAEAVGLRIGDRIVRVNGREAHAPGEVADALGEIGEGGEVRMSIVRQGEAIELRFLHPGGP